MTANRRGSGSAEEEEEAAEVAAAGTALQEAKMKMQKQKLAEKERWEHWPGKMVERSDRLERLD